MTALDWRRLWEEAIRWDRFLTPTMELAALWTGVVRQASPLPWAVARLGTGDPPRFLSIAHDWCWDAANSMPWLAALVGAVPGAELRIILRDDHPEVIDQFLTNGTRSIPIVVGLGPNDTILGHWGPRPAKLQAWVVENKPTMPKDQRYVEMRRWYLRDKGESTIREILTAIGRIER